jgi:YHS domain-containing protein
MPLARRTVLAALAVLTALGSLTSPVLARSDEVYTGILSSLAVGGYDPVAYFESGKPVEGSSQFTTEYKGATWQFASQEHLDKFLASPDAYAPQYGGYCAWAVSNGYTASGDPNIWKIVDGKLYLNYDENVQTEWEKDIPGHITKADGNWPAVLDK